MTDVINFRGQMGVNGEREVFITTAGGEHSLVPELGTRFNWGTMSDSVGNLAQAICAALFPEAERSFASSVVKRHFLTAVNANDHWELSGQEIRAYVQARQVIAAGSPTSGVAA